MEAEYGDEGYDKWDQMLDANPIKLVREARRMEHQLHKRSVWIVEHEGFSSQIFGVYATKEEAEKAIAISNGALTHPNSFRVEEWDV